MDRWFYIEVGRRKGPVNEKRLKELFYSGAVLEQTLIWKRGLDQWLPYTKVFPDIEPKTRREEQAQEKRRARIDLAPKSVTCGVCNQLWPAQYTLATRNGWVCLGCKDRLDKEALQGFDPRKMPKAGPPWLLIIALVALGGYFLADREVKRHERERKAEAREAELRGEDRTVFTPGRVFSESRQLMLWGGSGRAQGLKEPWMDMPPEQWPQLVTTHNAQIGGKYRVEGGNGVLVQSLDDLVVICSLSFMHPHVAHYLRTLPDVPPELFRNWRIEGLGVEGSSARSVRILQRLAGPDDYRDSDLVLLKVAEESGEMKLPAVPLLLRVNPLEREESVTIVVHDREAVPPLSPLGGATGQDGEAPPPMEEEGAEFAKQRLVSATVVSLLQQGRRVEVNLRREEAPRSLLGAPMIDKGGFLVGVVAAKPGVNQEQPTIWISGETVAGLTQLLEKTALPAR